MENLTNDEKLVIGGITGAVLLFIIVGIIVDSGLGDEASQSLKLQEIMKKAKKLQNSATARRLRSVGQHTVTHKPWQVADDLDSLTNELEDIADDLEDLADAGLKFNSKTIQEKTKVFYKIWNKCHYKKAQTFYDIGHKGYLGMFQSWGIDNDKESGVVAAAKKFVQFRKQLGRINSSIKKMTSKKLRKPSNNSLINVFLQGKNRKIIKALRRGQNHFHNDPSNCFDETVQDLPRNGYSTLVRDIQIDLIKSGFLHGSADGYYGRQTGNAIWDFCEAILQVDDVYQMNYGTRNAKVLRVQKLLILLSCLKPGQADGVYGPGTQKALECLVNN